jgi:hypothetical protein
MRTFDYHPRLEPRRSSLPGKHIATLLRQTAEAIERSDRDAYSGSVHRLGEAGYTFGHATEFKRQESDR